MMRHVLFAIFVCLAGAASAQTVVVRSGEHGTFTRLALDMPYRADWRIDSGPDGARIVFPESGLDFNTARVFDRINRNRLRAINPARGLLHLDFGCDCEIQAFWHTEKMLVLDIAEAVPSTLSPQRRPPTVASNRDLATATSPRSTATATLMQSLATTVPKPPTAQANDALRLTADDQTFDLSQLREKLLRELGRAASQGLLTPSRLPLPAPAQISTNDTSAIDADADAPRHKDHVAPDHPRMIDGAPLNLRAQSSIDLAITSRRAATRPLDPQANCLPAGWVDLPSWGDDSPFHQQVGDLNRQLLQEFDRPDKDTALRLARMYLYFGFGAEARHILDLRPERSQKDDILREMALIMDRGRTPEGARLAGTAGCGEPAVLWALLAQPTVSPETVFDHKALLRSFAALPASLRDTFGPELARRLIEARHSNTAQSILRMTGRTGAPENPDLALARADLAEAENDQDKARTELNTAVSGNSVAAPEALAQLIAGLLSKGVPVPLDKAELAGAYAYENRGTELGRRMTDTYLAAMGASGAFAKAVSEFERLQTDLDAAGAADIAASLMRQMARHADDVTFLRHALSDRLITPDAVSAALGVDIATRLLASGFVEQAKGFVAADLPGRGDRLSKLMRAEIALMQDRPRQAEVELLGLDGADANGLRATARSLAGDYAAAQTLYSASGQTEKATEAAWFAQDLDRVTDAKDPVLRQAAEILLNESQQPQTGSGAVLERHRNLLESASTLRATMKILLDAKAAPTDPQG